YENSLLHKLTYFGDVDTVNDSSWFHRFLYAVATDTDRWDYVKYRMDQKMFSAGPGVVSEQPAGTETGE
ncbi:MAG: hypothetical protein MJ175_12060, partial [Clostridia bacterium]|nr:hypothetical protein [Clostridia bacterium]